MKWAIVCLLLCTGVAAAHDFQPGVLALVETAPGELAIRFVAPVDSRGDSADVAIDWPAGCAAIGTRVDCAGGLGGTLGARGLTGAMKLVVTLERTTGAHEEWILDAGTPRLVFGGTPHASGLPWLGVGIEHIFGGLDHLAFVIGLLLVLDVAVGRRLLFTITAFTVAHSLTLALAVLGVIAVPRAPVEACIAASVLLVAREATHRAPTLVRRWPWLAAALFGLVHGLGFASALGELALPRTSLASTLLWFNVGVELGSSPWSPSSSLRSRWRAG